MHRIVIVLATLLMGTQAHAAEDVRLGALAAGLPAEEHRPNPPRPHVPYKGEVPLDSPEGRALLGPEPSEETRALLGHWVPQYKSHCGAASAVIVANSLGATGEPLTQNSLFTEAVTAIKPQSAVYNEGFSLRQLARTIEARTGMEAEFFHAGEGEGEHGLEEFLAALEASEGNPLDRVVVNFSVNNLRDGGQGGGHFSPVAAYNAEAGMALLLEVNGNRPVAWVPAEELYKAAATRTGPEADGPTRGWIVVRPKQDPTP